MKQRYRFFPAIERNIMAIGDDADPELHIIGNKDALTRFLIFELGVLG